jgi:hypothetical protein
VRASARRVCFGSQALASLISLSFIAAVSLDPNSSEPIAVSFYEFRQKVTGRLPVVF